jgi:hypothetical protein
MIFDKGDRVSTPAGTGTILYRRMAAPDYNSVAAYSVCLDTKKIESEKPPFPFYSGTIFKAEEVSQEQYP